MELITKPVGLDDNLELHLAKHSGSCLNLSPQFTSIALAHWVGNLVRWWVESEWILYWMRHLLRIASLQISNRPWQCKLSKHQMFIKMASRAWVRVINGPINLEQSTIEHTRKKNVTWSLLLRTQGKNTSPAKTEQRPDDAATKSKKNINAKTSHCVPADVNTDQTEATSQNRTGQSLHTRPSVRHRLHNI